MPKEYNYPHVETSCPECHHTNILTDPFRGETYCTRCGLVLHENRIPSIPDQIKRHTYKIRFIRGLWRKKRQK